MIAEIALENTYEFDSLIDHRKDNSSFEVSDDIQYNNIEAINLRFDRW